MLLSLFRLLAGLLLLALCVDVCCVVIGCCGPWLFGGVCVWCLLAVCAFVFVCV